MMVDIQLFTTTNKKGFWYAYVAAMASSGVGGGKNRSRFKLGAVLMDHQLPITAKCNSLKTHPYLARFTPFPFLHAESATILSHGLENCKGLDLYVVRIKANGSLGLAKPCTTCTQLINYVGIRNCYYSTDKSTMENLFS